MSAYPKSLVWIVASVGGLAVFLVVASLFLVSQPVGPAISRYFYGVNHSKYFDSMSSANGTLVNSSSYGDISKEEMLDQPRANSGAPNEPKVDNVSVPADEAVKVPQLSTEVLSSLSIVQGNISNTHSGQSGSTVHHIFLVHTCKSFWLNMILCFFFFLRIFLLIGLAIKRV